jgi:DNA-binding HxlR family transcriptional regulator
LDVLGDKWILVIVKQMLIEGAETFKDFTQSDEAIATNILSAKLKMLEAYGIVAKTPRPENKKSPRYLLTEKGLSLAPVLVELAHWSDQHLRELHPGLQEGEGMQWLRRDKPGFTRYLENQYREKLN